jgi:STE24 endopeptidase
MNVSKSTRYHRLARRASLLVTGVWMVVLVGMQMAAPAVDRPLYGLFLALLGELLTSPIEFYRGHILERRFGLSSNTVRHWARQHALAGLARTSLLVIAVEIVYALIQWRPEFWWVLASALAALLAALLTWLAPVLVLPLFFKLKPLDRPHLADRLLTLSAKAGVRAIGVHEWSLGGKTTRANAMLAGAGRMRRILVSDTLLASFSDDEIEVILAHELGHHVHRDIPTALALEMMLLVAAFGLASLMLDVLSQPLGLNAPSDIRGLPVLLLVVGMVYVASGPLLNAFSRHNERRADRYALHLTQRSDAFVSAMRRLGAQNLVEESPSRLAVWLFHTHPPIEERIAAARTAVI